MDQANHHQQDPMAEIALALAMGFFSVMVLALVSMGAGEVLEGEVATAQEAPRIEAMILRPAPASPSATTRPPPARERLVVYHAGRLLDAELRPLDPRTLLEGEAAKAPLVLAIAPDLPLAEVMDARRRIERDDVVIAALDDRWLEALKRNSQ